MTDRILRRPTKSETRANGTSTGRSSTKATVASAARARFFRSLPKRGNTRAIIFLRPTFQLSHVAIATLAVTTGWVFWGLSIVTDWNA